MRPLSAEQCAYLQTEFLERLAHDLRGPAGVTLGALSEIESSLPDPSLGPLLLMARRGVQRVVRIASLLQQTAQFERAHPEVLKEPCDVASLVEASAREAESLEARRKVKMTIDRPASCPLQADARWLGVLIFELTSNAIRHAQSQVHWTVTPQPQGGVLLSVHNDGPAPESLGPVRFQSSRRRGLGLGLALVQDIVQAHQGTLLLEPGGGKSPPAGTRVTVSLPA